MNRIRRILAALATAAGALLAFTAAARPHSQFACHHRAGRSVILSSMHQLPRPTSTLSLSPACPAGKSA
jgi:hypothetical protein